MGYTLSGVRGEYSGASYQITPSLILGRSASKCNIVYQNADYWIGEVHCSVENRRDGCYLTDFGSSYGTYLDNGTRLSPNVPVKLNNGQGFYLADPSHSFVVNSSGGSGLFSGISFGKTKSTSTGGLGLSLSNGAIVGIAVGCIAFLIILFLGVGIINSNKRISETQQQLAQTQQQLAETQQALADSNRSYDEDGTTFGEGIAGTIIDKLIDHALDAILPF